MLIQCGSKKKKHSLNEYLCDDAVCFMRNGAKKREKKNEFPIRVIPLTVNVSDVFNRMKMQSKRYGRIFFIM